jgi:hypothetical protein
MDTSLYVLSDIHSWKAYLWFMSLYSISPYMKVVKGTAVYIPVCLWNMLHTLKQENILVDPSRFLLAQVTKYQASQY